MMYLTDLHPPASLDEASLDGIASCSCSSVEGEEFVFTTFSSIIVS